MSNCTDLRSFVSHGNEQKFIKDLNMDMLKDYMPYILLAVILPIMVFVVVSINMQKSSVSEDRMGQTYLIIDPWEYEKNTPPFNLFMGEDVEDSRLIP